MAKRVRNNALRMKKSLQKALLKTNEESNKVKERHLKEKARKKSLLDSLDKMSYNDLRKLASEAGVTIYQRKKEEIKQDLKDYYERLWSETH